MTTFKSKKLKGFTLIEMLLYIGLLSIFLFVLTDLFVSALDLRLETEATSSVDQDGRFILERFTYDMARADAIITPANLGETSQSLTLDIGGNLYTYSLADNRLVLSDAFGSDFVNSSRTKINSLVFEKLGNGIDNDTVRLEFDLESQVIRDQGPEMKSFQTTGGTR